MATVTEEVRSRGGSGSRVSGRSRLPEDEPRLSKLKLLAPGGALFLLTVAWSVYLYFFGFSKGADSTAPEYAQYWYPMLAFNLLVLHPAVFLVIVRLATRRCRVCAEQKVATGSVARSHELEHHWMFFGILLTGGLAVLGGFAIALGGDAAWHQSAFRDTAVTPIHIFSFYGFVPLSFLALVGSYVYARTRLPEVFGPRRGLSMAFAIFIAGGLFGMVNFAFNEFGHAMWIYEELFTYPMHWPFVLFGANVLAIFALATMSLTRVSQLLTASGGEGAAASRMAATAH